MTIWAETFSQSDITDLDSDLGFLGAGLDLIDTYATNSVGSSAGIMYQVTTTPATLSQEIRALVAFETETPSSGTDSHSIMVCNYANVTGTVQGYGVRLIYANADVRTLEIVREAGAGEDVLATLTLTTEVLSVAGSDLLVSQEIRLIATPVEGGTRLRAYINDNDDDFPTIEFTDYRDPFDLTGSVFGQWAIITGAAALNALRILEIHGQDLDERLPPVVQLQDRHTLSEIRANVLTRVDGSSVGTDRAGDMDFMNEIINSTVEEILDEVGDVALFMQPVEVLTLTAGVDRITTMPAYVDKVISIVETDRDLKPPWHFLGYTSDGVVQIIFDRGYAITGRTTRVHYQMKYQRMDVDTDLCVIPRRFTEAVVYGAIMRIAEYDTNDSLHRQTMERYQQKVTQIKRAMNRMLRGSRTPMVARRRASILPFGKHLTTPIVGYVLPFFLLLLVGW